MTRRAGQPQRLTLTFRSGARDDYAALTREERRAARAILEDLAKGAVTGKALGNRHVSGDLTGCYRVKFDAEGRHPQSLRLVYRLTGPSTAEVFAIGRRDEHAIYRLAVERVRRDS